MEPRTSGMLGQQFTYWSVSAALGMISACLAPWPTGASWPHLQIHFCSADHPKATTNLIITQNCSCSGFRWPESPLSGSPAPGISAYGVIKASHFLLPIPVPRIVSTPLPLDWNISSEFTRPSPLQPSHSMKLSPCSDHPSFCQWLQKCESVRDIHRSHSSWNPGSTVIRSMSLGKWCKFWACRFL